VLLGTVVQLALDAAPVGIGSEHEPLPRRSQLVDLGAQAVAQLLQCLDPRILQRDRLLLDYAELSVIVHAAVKAGRRFLHSIGGRRRCMLVKAEPHAGRGAPRWGGGHTWRTR
jgi:hypothetical protein